jgi:signal transduction histidine kinase
VSSYIPRARQVSWRGLLAAGLTAAALAGLAGGALERWRFGASDAAAAGRVEQMVRREFDAMSSAVVTIAAGAARDPSAMEGLSASGPEGARILFDLVARAQASSPHPHDISVTVYDVKGVARAWTGRPSDIPNERIVGPQDLFVMPSELGLRLVQLQPVTSGDSRRFGAVAVEHVLSRVTAGAAIAPADYSLETSLAPVSLRTRYEGAGDRPRAGSFLLQTPAGAPLVEASVAAEDLQRARSRWRRTVLATVVAILGVTLVLLVGPLLDARAATRDGRSVLRKTLAASVLLAAGTATGWLAIALSTGGWPAAGINLAFCGMGLAGLAALWAAPAVQLRLMYQSRRRTPGAAIAQYTLMHLAAGAIVTALVGVFVGGLSTAVDPATIDLRHFSMHPWNGSRVLMVTGILALQVAVLWLATLVLVAARAAWRLPHGSTRARLTLLAIWLTPTAIAAAVVVANSWPMPASALVISVAACGAAALIGSRIVTWFRHATVAARILVLFLAFLVPAILLYPSLDYYAELATRRLIASRYAVEAQNHSKTLLDKLAQARREIDAVPSLADLVSGRDETSETTTNPDSATAFRVWSQTVLAAERLTSNVELYDRRGKPVSRFALNLPEYTGTGQPPQGAAPCEWDVYGENLPIGSEERLVLHAQRSICTTDGSAGPPQAAGMVVVHVALDYRTLPFITSQSPYFEVFRPSGTHGVREGTPGADVGVAIYGWGLQPIYTSGLSSWPITDELFQRLYDPGRAPFWTTILQGHNRYQVYFTNDRARIYALGYPALTLFDHLVHFAEVSTLAGAAFVLVLLGTAVFTRLSRERPRVGRALLREIRASFYRKLFLAFVMAATVPVLILALVIRAYVADLLRSDVQAEAARTAAVAQRVIEESDALLRRAPQGGVGPNDDLMVWISQVINQDVNIFDGPELVATSERDLFSSGLLPTRTPDAVYRAIVLQGLPSFVNEDLLGTLPYLIAATPVRYGGRNNILTVPLALRQRDIEREIDDLDRGVHLATLFFILLGAAIGLSLAERIADPVRRLTRATQRIAHGDFDARIAVRSVDELRRLVDAFNSMAAELKAQRGQLERTHRLEAWAEMARQVAHEIKNPLTPIQLSAEHLRRVHLDKGQPLGSVLDGCVTSILGQVRLLRQIAAEFSSFASSPRAKPSTVDVPHLVAEILDPYRAGLAGRIEIDNRAVGPLPPVRVDRTLIARALANIMENALHAMPGRGRLTIDASAHDGLVTLVVRDSGVGMDQESLARVFEPYFSTKTTGTGLGLTIARRNIELNGGTIDVGSEKGVGTTVTVTFPVAVTEENSGARPS